MEEQQKLQTPVARFSEKHEELLSDEGTKAYSDLIPLNRPQPGEQYAFRVNLDKCTGCKACVTACHNLNGLDVREAWRDAGKIVSEKQDTTSYQQTITTACHHCSDPACLNGCPVLAYEKDPVTGIVRHLDDQCIGCQYCVLKCPYDVPKYNKSLGIVRKCDMCHYRLEAGEAPACVQACPNEAISIVNTSKKTIELQSHQAFLPGAPGPKYTKPATQYISTKTLDPSLVPADRYSLKVQDSHLPLVFMLIITQMGIGLYLWGSILSQTHPDFIQMRHFDIILFGAVTLGVGFSTLHLGQPLKAWKAFLGLRKSWMSREVIAFALIIKLAALMVLLQFVPFLPYSEQLIVFLRPLTLFTGLFAVYCSVKLYQDTQRRLWQFRITAFRFFTSLIGLGSAGGYLYLIISGSREISTILFVGSLVVSFSMIIWKIYLEENRLGKSKIEVYSVEKRAALIILRKLPVYRMLRFISAALGLIFLGTSLPLYLQLSVNSGIIAGSTGLLLLFGSELVERFFFFTTVDSPKMPGEFDAS